jgi:hypothetical protein
MRSLGEMYWVGMKGAGRAEQRFVFVSLSGSVPLKFELALWKDVDYLPMAKPTVKYPLEDPPRLLRAFKVLPVGGSLHGRL